MDHTALVLAVGFWYFAGRFGKHLYFGSRSGTFRASNMAADTTNPMRESGPAAAAAAVLVAGGAVRVVRAAGERDRRRAGPDGHAPGAEGLHRGAPGTGAPQAGECRAARQSAPAPQRSRDHRVGGTRRTGACEARRNPRHDQGRQIVATSSATRPSSFRTFSSIDLNVAGLSFRNCLTFSRP